MERLHAEIILRETARQRERLIDHRAASGEVSEVNVVFTLAQNLRGRGTKKT